MNGFQLIPVNAVTSAASGANSENSAWLQGTLFSTLHHQCSERAQSQMSILGAVLQGQYRNSIKTSPPDHDTNECPRLTGTIGSSGCNNAIVSSNNYFLSTDYLAKLNSTFAFYQSILPVINGSFTAATSTAASAQGSTTDSFKNAYTSKHFSLGLSHNEDSNRDSLRLGSCLNDPQH